MRTAGPVRYCQIIPGLLLLFAVGCSSVPEPPEIRRAEEQSRRIASAGASVYTPSEYALYQDALSRGMNHFRNEEARFRWFRNYRSVQDEFRNILDSGEALFAQIEQRKSSAFKSRISLIRAKIDSLYALTNQINEGRYARSGLVKADIILKEADVLYRSGDFDAARQRIDAAVSYLEEAGQKIRPIIGRYSDRDQISMWQAWVKQTIAESREKKTAAIVVNKLDRTLKVYMNGVVRTSFSVGLGRNGSMDKLHAGDNATPEGMYRIVRKLPNSAYYKALLINYPNDDDRERFRQAKKKGQVPEKTGIGGLIEIHGGGKDSMTYGCIALDNHHMDELYTMIPVGTMVTIVGTENYDNSLSAANQ